MNKITNGFPLRSDGSKESINNTQPKDTILSRKSK